MDEIRRISGPRTTNGTEWETEVSAIPSREWLELFKRSDEYFPFALPGRVVFDRTAATFRSDEQHVPQWIQSIDRWIASTNARHLARLDEASRQRALREEAETNEKERIRQLNERFKDL